MSLSSDHKIEYLLSNILNSITLYKAGNAIGVSATNSEGSMEASVDARPLSVQWSNRSCHVTGLMAEKVGILRAVHMVGEVPEELLFCNKNRQADGYWGTGPYLLHAYQDISELADEASR